MRPFTYERAADTAARGQGRRQPGAKFLAGGTNLLDLMKLEIETPAHLIDVGRLPMASRARPTAACASAPWPPTPTSPPTPGCARAIRC